MSRALLLLVLLLAAAHDPPAAASARPPAGRAPGGLPLVIAHRGASALAPEHTFFAWDRAFEAGADFLELDLQMTADGHLVVLHDERLARTARGPAEDCSGVVSERTLAQLRHCDAGSWFNRRHPERARNEYVGARIPTLREVLERYAPRGARFYIETKHPEQAPGLEEKLLQELRRFDLLVPAAAGALPRVILQSFHAPSLRNLRAMAPELPRVQLIPSRTSTAELRAALPEIAGYAQGIGPHFRQVDAALVRAAHEQGLFVHAYTVDDEASMRRLLEIGVDGLFTNRPARMRSLLQADAAARPPGPDGPAAPTAPGSRR